MLTHKADAEMNSLFALHSSDISDQALLYFYAIRGAWRLCGSDRCRPSLLYVRTCECAPKNSRDTVSHMSDLKISDMSEESERLFISASALCVSSDGAGLRRGRLQKVFIGGRSPSGSETAANGAMKRFRGGPGLGYRQAPITRVKIKLKFPTPRR